MLDNEGKSLLRKAVEDDHQGVATTLLAAGAKANIFRSLVGYMISGVTAGCYSGFKQKDAMTAIIKHGTNVSSASVDGIPTLYLALKSAKRAFFSEPENTTMQRMPKGELLLTSLVTTVVLKLYWPSWGGCICQPARRHEESTLPSVTGCLPEQRCHNELCQPTSCFDEREKKNREQLWLYPDGSRKALRAPVKLVHSPEAGHGSADTFWQYTMPRCNGNPAAEAEAFLLVPQPSDWSPIIRAKRVTETLGKKEKGRMLNIGSMLGDRVRRELVE